MSDESQEKVRQMRELLAKSQTSKGNAEHVQHVTADRGGIAVHAGGSVHIGMSPVAQKKPFFDFNRLAGLYFSLIVAAYVLFRLEPLWQGRPRGLAPIFTLQYMGDQAPLWELAVLAVGGAAIAACLAGITRRLLR
ncbi:hypothetical protein VDF76_05965 [Xanthomonas campestris pv. raphani]|uniref:hypothetical protein n=1 Tax=Xanthomonas campestris TaxID=339 RepID=UPI002B222755|nr:hypothetical protein [Xanthomonas campestris]MEA9746584.1 hypothetical protein [Xanthomonas campestris pv. raphani]MEA9846620.1 hypothetical protein [Xanthomonas campestris pv. raphani]MEA9927512.1 hypothetical protein [Xanthomonas campestris pv. raphani]